MWPFGKGAKSDSLKDLRRKKKDSERKRKQALSQDQRIPATYTDAFVSPRYSAGLSVSQTSSTLVQPLTP